MTRCAFLLDECLPAPLVSAFRRPGIDIELDQVGDVGLPAKGTTDPELLAFCEEQRRILVTADRESFPVHWASHFAMGRRTFGVFLVSPDKPWALIYEDILLVAECSSADEWIDQTIYLPQFSTLT